MYSRLPLCFIKLLPTTFHPPLKTTQPHTSLHSCTILVQSLQQCSVEIVWVVPHSVRYHTTSFIFFERDIFSSYKTPLLCITSHHTNTTAKIDCLPKLHSKIMSCKGANGIDCLATTSNKYDLFEQWLLENQSEFSLVSAKVRCWWRRKSLDLTSLCEVLGRIIIVFVEIDSQSDDCNCSIYMSRGDAM